MNCFNSGSSTAGRNAALISFYEGTGKDYLGRSLEDMLEWGYLKLEADHQFIQTLFPLPEVSAFQQSPAVIDRQVFEAFRSRPELRNRLRDALKKMLCFYGFELGSRTDGGPEVLTSKDYKVRFQNWQTYSNHNHNRITRIIRSLRVLGLEEEAFAVYNAFAQDASKVSKKSIKYWGRAAFRPLNIAPAVESADEDDEEIGLQFLAEFERKRRASEKEQDKEDKDKKEEDRSTVSSDSDKDEE